MKNMNKFRFGLLVLGLILIIINLFRLDYGNLDWSNNDNLYLGIISMLCLIIAMITSIYSDNKRQKTIKQ